MSEQAKCFTKYIRLVLPLDGFVFWVRADLVSSGALFNAAQFNGAQFNARVMPITPAAQTFIKGSFHYATDLNQDQAETYSSNTVIFTAEKSVTDLDFNQIGPNVLYIGTFQEMRYAFSRRDLFFENSNIHHYVGHAIYSTMDSQFIDNVAQLNTRALVVSNSLPIWLSMNSYTRPYDYFSNTIPLFPSFLSPQNQVPPYGTIDIPPETTKAIAGSPYLGRKLSHYQLAQETVRIVFYGIANDAALSFMDFVNQFSIDTDLIGLMNMPIIRDEKKTQVEFGILAMKKSAEFQISYYQQSVRDIARQLILEAIPTYYLGAQVAA